ncbi:MAG: HNH endonuclease [Yaniella sp.]|uniref:HNH endonuclease signature motif containing protein n=1 Tax=Yaniella sp. TaxID=2773929 RepID=UPI002649BF95|nr:HNH endonuclease signature motif containing protein [Yaniella sp.]MDN5731947.1 HNH endonuclease [Yaniella sp.]
MTTSSPTPSSVPHEPTRDNQLPETGHSQTETLFPAHATAVQRLRRQYGDELDAMTTGELLAMQSLINQRLDKVTEKQLASETKPTNNPDASLSLGDLSRIAEENHRRHYNFLCSLAVQLEEWFESPEARSATLAHKGKDAFKDAQDFQSRLNGIDSNEVERRLRIAGANPTRPGASKMRAPKIQRAMSDGNMDPASANYIIDRLRSIRAATKRAGGSDAQADQLVATKEGEFLAKALNASPAEVRRFADRVKRGTNRQFTAPGTRLTPKQRQYEEGLRFVTPLGDNHVRLDWVLTKWQYKNVLERLRQQVNNLRSQISRINEDAKNDDNAKRLAGSERITPADEEYEIPMLYDNRTVAQRWSHFLLDILETGIILTSFPSGKAQESIDAHTHRENDAHEDRTPSGVTIPGLGQLVNAAPSVTVGLQYADLAGRYLDFGSDDPNVQAEIAALLEGRKAFPELYDYDTVDMDWARLRQLSCNASIIPTVLGSKSEPLDVGRAQRAFPASIRRAVILRDGGCAYPGCYMPHIYSEIHHIIHWQNNGATSLENAVMLCRFHHDIIHQTEVLVRLNDEQFPEFLLEPNTQEAAWVRNLMHRGC